MMLTWIKKEKFNLTLCLIAGAGLSFRVWGMWFGLPLLLNPDEPIFVDKAMRFGTGNFNPYWFGHPGNNLMYILFFEFIGYYFLGHFFNWFNGVEVFKDLFFSDPTTFYLLGRSIGVLSGTLSVVAIGYLGKRLVNERVGIIAALFLGVSPLCIQHSKLIRTDILGTLFVLTAIYFGLKFWDSRRRKYVIISSIAIGMAVASKYPNATLGIVILLLTYFLGMESSESFMPKYGQENSHWKFLLLNCLVILLSFFVVTPFFFLDFKKAYQDIVIEAVGTQLGAGSFPLLKNYWWYISDVLTKDFGLPILIGASFGLLHSVRNIDKRTILILAFPVIFFIFIGLLSLRWDRWVIPILPFIGLYAAIALDYLFVRIFLFINVIVEEQKNVTAIKLLTTIILLSVFIFHPLKESIASNRNICLPDTRQLCTEWIKKNIPEGKFAQDWYGFQPSPRYAYFIGEFQINKYTILQDYSIARKTLEEYRANGFTHLIVSSLLYRRYFLEVERYPREVQFYQSLFTRVPLKTFESIDEKVTGPNIVIYSID